MTTSAEEKINKFIGIKSLQGLADFLKISLISLNILIERANNCSDYYTFAIPKKRGGERIILAPNKILKAQQRKILSVLNHIYVKNYGERASHGFILNKSVLTNAKGHIGKKSVLNVDLENFFPTIHFGRIRGLFLNFPFNFSDEIATILAKLCCYDGKLPQGASTSPILSNFICRGLDNDLYLLANKNSCFYSRYADDISLSTYRNTFPKNIAYIQNKKTHAGSALIEIIKKHGFEINHEKSRLQKKDRRQEVTGIVVNKKINLVRKFFKNILATLHQIDKNGLVQTQNNHIQKYNNGQPCDLQKILIGKINYAKMILSDTHMYNVLAKKFNEVFQKDYFKILPESKNILENLLKNSIFRITGENDIEGTAFYLKNGFVITCAHCLCENYETTNFDELVEKNRLQKIIKLHYPFDSSNVYKIEITKVNIDADYAILKFNDFYLTEGLEISKNSIDYQGEKLTIVGYQKNEGETTFSLPCITTGKKRIIQTTFILVDKTLIGGLSGSPVFNYDNKVVGIVTHGQDTYIQSSETIKAFNAFLPIDNISEINSLCKINI